jgi:hypothetical protein
MFHALFLTTALLLAGGDSYADRPRHPVAPSLPILTKEENAKLDAVVDKFIQHEIGKLPKAQEKQAKDDLYRLGPEAIFALVDGFNRAAQMESSCATVTIGKKIEIIVSGSNDIHLLTYVRENVAAGVDDKTKRKLPLVNTIRNVQTTCLLRKGEILRKGLAVTPPAAKAKAISLMSMAELEKAAAKERDDTLKKVLTEIEKRDSVQTPALLGKAASSADPEAAKLGKALLLKHAEKQSPTQLKALLKHTSAEVRAAAARTIGSKGLHYGDELIALLQDEASNVQQAARAALVQLADGPDFGPPPNASFGDRAAAAQKWRKWWQSQQ